MKASDYLCEYLLSHGIDTIFCVTGGTIAHILNSIKQRPAFKIYFNYCESGCSMAAKSYQKVSGKIPLVLITNGPATTHVITGVVGAYQASVPFLVISGQCYANQVLSVMAPDVRSLGAQELHVLPIVASFTKYSQQVRDAHRVPHILDTALYHMLEGRPGPVWLEFPLDIQAIEVDPPQLLRGPAPYVPSAYTDPRWYEQIVAKLRASKRPLLYIGYGVRGANAIAELNQVARLLHIPVATSWTAMDILDADNKQALHVGNPGMIGEAAPGVAVQTADFMLAVGTRLGIHSHNDFAAHSWQAMVDIDAAELTKPTINIDLRIACDCKVFLNGFIKLLDGQPVDRDDEWLDHLKALGNDAPGIQPKLAAHHVAIGPYFFVDVLSKEIPEDTCIVTELSSTCYACVHEAFRTQRDKVRIVSSSGAFRSYLSLSLRLPLLVFLLVRLVHSVALGYSMQRRVPSGSACRGSSARR
jgi:acetolactate synthase-1/2/3 large subunit